MSSAKEGLRLPTCHSGTDASRRESKMTPISQEMVQPDLGKTEQSPVPGPMADAGRKAEI